MVHNIVVSHIATTFSVDISCAICETARTAVRRSLLQGGGFHERIFCRACLTKFDDAAFCVVVVGRQEKTATLSREMNSRDPTALLQSRFPCWLVH
jgi:hypothetical protein